MYVNLPLSNLPFYMKKLVILRNVFPFLCVTGHSMDDTCIAWAICLCKTVVSSFSYSLRKKTELGEVQMQLGLLGHQLTTESAAH